MSDTVQESNVKKRDFDKDAASWDEKPARIRLANDIASAILDENILNPDMDVLDFGCGTGLLTLQLRTSVHSIVGVDNSEGMLNVFRRKIESQGLTNMEAQFLDLERGEVLKGKFHLVISSMAFHHIQVIKPLIKQFREILTAGGYLCIADLDSDEGRFHDKPDGVFHHGFDRAALRQDFAEAGFRDVRDRTAAEVVKPLPEGGERAFTVFLMTGRKEE